MSKDAYAPFRVRDYRNFIIGFFISVLGAQMFDLAVGWELYARTNSPAALGFAGLAEALPVMLLSLWAGHFADHHSRRLIMICSLTLTVAVAVAMAFVSYFKGPIWMVYGLLFLAGCARAFRSPAASALVPQLVPVSLLGGAIAWKSSFFEISSISGPMLGGFLVAAFNDYWMIYALDALCMAGYVALLFTIREPARAESELNKPRTPLKESLVAGIRFIKRSPLILSTITLDLFAVFLGGSVALLPVFAKDILHVDSVGLGWLRAAPAFGAFTMAFTLAHLPLTISPLRNAGKALLISVTGFGLATIVFGLSKSFWLSMAALFLTGAFDNISVVVRMTLISKLTPDEMRGRVNAVNYIFVGASNELGAFESGVTAQAFGPIASVVFGGIGTIATVLAVLWKWPQLRKLKEI